jgi:hypothetical protein
MLPAVSEATPSRGRPIVAFKAETGVDGGEAVCKFAALFVAGF